MLKMFMKKSYSSARFAQKNCPEKIIYRVIREMFTTEVENLFVWSVKENLVEKETCWRIKKSVAEFDSVMNSFPLRSLKTIYAHKNDSEPAATQFKSNESALRTPIVPLLSN